VNIAFIRHGKTIGNVQRRYVGSTDGPLCTNGIEELLGLKQQGIYPQVQHVYVSPMLRCLQTGDMIYHAVPHTIVTDLREQYYGNFENKTYDELQHIPAFRRWIDTAGASNVPNGEPQKDFFIRCRAALGQVLKDAKENGFDQIAVVAHGGVLMALLSAYAEPHRSFYEWHAANGRGYLFSADSWYMRKTLTLLSEI